MKSLTLITASLLAGASVQASATSIAPRAAVVHVFGTGASVEESAVRQVRQILGEAYASETLESIFHKGYGIEGGFQVCVTKAPHAPLGALTDVAHRVWAVPHDPARTDLDVSFVDSCQ